MTGWSGLKGLDQRPTRLVAAAGASRHLIEQLEGALRGARIAASQSQIGVDDADEREMRKIVALGDKLGADDDIEGAFGDLVQFAPQPLGAARKIRRKHENARIRKERRRLFGEPLDPRPAGGERCPPPRIRGKLRAAVRHGRNGGTSARGESDVRQARRRNFRSGSDGRMLRQTVNGA